MKVIAAFAVLMLVCAGAAGAQGLGVHMLGGVTIGDDLPDGRVDNPGFNFGAGVDFGFSENFVLRGTAVYTFFPFWSGVVPTDVGDSVRDGDQRHIELELVLRLSPRGVTPPGAPVLYFLLGTGPGILMSNPAPDDGDDQTEYSFGMAGIGFESKVGDGRHRVWFELVGRVTSHEVGSYYPIRAGFRF